MPSINDLKTNNGYTGSGTAAGTDDGGVLSFGSVNMKKPKVNTTLNLGSVNKKAADSDDDFSTPKRKIADLSSLPDRELMGVDVKQSIEDEVFKKGGEFDAVRNKKIKEMMEINELIDAHNAEVAANLGIDVPSDEELQQIGQEDMTPAIIGTKYYDQSDAFGRSQGKVKTSPLEEKAAAEGKNIDQYLSGEDAPTTTILNENGEVEQVKVYNSTPTNMNFDDEDDYMDEMEKELNEEFDTPKRKVSIITGDEAKEELVEEINDSEIFADDEVIEEDIKEEPVEEKPQPKVQKKEETPKVEIPKPVKKEADAFDKVAEAVKDPNVGIDVNFDIDDEDMDDIDLEPDEDQPAEVEEVDPDESLKALQTDLSKKLKPIANKLDLSSFTVVKRPVALSPSIMETERVAMSWALPNSNQYIAISEFSGKELEQLGDNSGTDRFQTMRNRYKLFYDHIVSDKPATLEQWLKTVSFADNDHLFFAVYGANFAGANFIPYDCPDCKNTFLSDNIPIEQMYKFDNEETEAKFKKIRESQQSLPAGLYVSEITQISDKIAIGFRDPSIYTMIFETTRLDEKFLEKYRDLIAIIAYIDAIYYIDPVNKQLAPIDYKIDTNNPVKTIKAKIITYAKILKNLAPDQYYTILSYLNAITQKTANITYVKPEIKCPNCDNVIPEEETTAENLVFTRAQLASLTLTSLN